ncbi:MAG: hypothetical protein HY951_09140 [Bacteroidia bacterium]|nr:hypothetical protein [Bacteroidia bacterium]
MNRSKLLILFFILTISQNCFCQLGPTLNLSSGQGDNYKGSLLLFSALNVTITTLNIVNINNSGKLKSSAGFGIVTGLSQITYGLIYKPKTNNKEFVILNIGLGTATIVTSCLRLFKNKSNKSNATSWNLFYVPIETNKFGVGISLTRKI